MNASTSELALGGDGVPPQTFSGGSERNTESHQQPDTGIDNTAIEIYTRHRLNSRHPQFASLASVKGIEDLVANVRR
jgi:hypothetical protein